MRRLITLGLSGLTFLSAVALPGLAVAQPVVAPAPAANPLISANPTYVTIEMETTIRRPAAQVWARVGKYCDIGEWMQRECHIVSGDGKIGTIRSVADEVLVGKSALSYTYAQTVAYGARTAGAARAYNLYHGTLEARPINSRSSKLIYTLFYDNSMVPGGEAGRKAEIDGRRARFQVALANMKLLAEGSKQPLAPLPAATAAPAPAVR